MLNIMQRKLVKKQKNVIVIYIAISFLLLENGKNKKNCKYFANIFLRK